MSADLIEKCPECWTGDAEYGTHHYGCPSGYATEDAPCAECRIDPEREALQQSYAEAEAWNDPAMAVAERGRPSKADDLQLELAARATEEQDAAASLRPHLQRLEMVARSLGPEAWAMYQGISTWHQRHERRWQGDREAAA